MGIIFECNGDKMVHLPIIILVSTSSNGGFRLAPVKKKTYIPILGSKLNMIQLQQTTISITHILKYVCI